MPESVGAHFGAGRRLAHGLRRSQESRALAEAEVTPSRLRPPGRQSDGGTEARHGHVQAHRLVSGLALGRVGRDELYRSGPVPPCARAFGWPARPLGRDLLRGRSTPSPPSPRRRSLVEVFCPTRGRRRVLPGRRGRHCRSRRTSEDARIRCRAARGVSRWWTSRGRCRSHDDPGSDLAEQQASDLGFEVVEVGFHRLVRAQHGPLLVPDPVEIGGGHPAQPANVFKADLVHDRSTASMASTPGEFMTP
jgi:hypothetical protein